MTSDEQRIVEFLETTNEFLSARQIGIFVGPPASCTNPTWAQPHLIRLTKAGVLEMSSKGEFRLKPSGLAHLPTRIAKVMLPDKAA
jgi:hypothetical protein